MHASLLDAKNVVMLTRDDGLRILVIQTGPLADIAQVQVDVRVGDDAEGMEDDGQRETAHFLEHLVASMLLSRKYPNGEAKAWVEEHGIYSNAFTSAVRTSHYMNGHASKLQEMIDIQVGAIADFMGHGDEHPFYKILSEGKRFTLEKEAVRRELSSKVDGPAYLMYEALNRAAFPGQPRSVSQQYDLKNVELLTPKIVKKFFTKHYVAKNMMVTIAGPSSLCEMAKIVRMLDKYTFSTDEPPKRFRVVSFENQPTYMQKILIRFVPIEKSSTVRITMAWPLRLRQYETTDQRRKDVSATSALTNFLTGGFTSRLLKRLRVEEGLVYSVTAGRDLDERDPAYGLYQIATSVEASDIPALIKGVFEELKRMSAEGPTDAEMEKYTLRIKTAQERRILNRSPGSWVDDYANQGLFSETFDASAIVTNAEHFRRALNVSRADVQRVASHVIDFFDGPMIFVYGGDEAHRNDDKIYTALLEYRQK